MKANCTENIRQSLSFFALTLCVLFLFVGSLGVVHWKEGVVAASANVDAKYPTLVHKGFMEGAAKTIPAAGLTLVAADLYPILRAPVVEGVKRFFRGAKKMVGVDRDDPAQYKELFVTLVTATLGQDAFELYELQDLEREFDETVRRELKGAPPMLKEDGTRMCMYILRNFKGTLLRQFGLVSDTIKEKYEEVENEVEKAIKEKEDAVSREDRREDDSNPEKDKTASAAA